jgi:hypothetical protein
MDFSTALTASRKELEKQKAGSSYREGTKPIQDEMMERAQAPSQQKLASHEMWANVGLFFIIFRVYMNIHILFKRFLTSCLLLSLCGFNISIPPISAVYQDEQVQNYKMRRRAPSDRRGHSSSARLSQRQRCIKGVPRRKGDGLNMGQKIPN